MYELFLATRFLWTRPLSWVSVIGIWLSVTATLTTVAIMSGFLDELHRTIQGTTGDIILSPRPTQLSREVLSPPAGFADIQRVTESLAGIESMSPHLLRPALLRVGEPGQAARLDERSFISVIGVDPVLEKRTTRFLEYATRVRDAAERIDDPARPFALDATRLPAELQANASLPVALVGIGMFRHFRMHKGQVIRLATMPGTPIHGEDEAIAPHTTRWVVGGAVLSGHFEYDARMIYVDLQTARQFAESITDTSEICVRTSPGTDIPALCKTLDQTFRQARLNVLVQDWEARHIVDLAPIRNQRTILTVLLLFFVAVACFNIFATLTILVGDKTRDIGLLNAMGASGRGIVAIFTRCGMVIASAGSVLGVITATLLIGNINGINDLIGDITGVRIFRGSIYKFDEIPTDIQPWFVAAVVAATIAFAVMCAFVPALRAARMDPVRALRYE